MARTYTPIEPPDVTVIVETVTQTPTVSAAVLPPCIVGPCYEIVEIINSDGSTNADAEVTLPAIIRSDEVDPTVGYNFAGGTAFTIEVNNGAPVSINLTTGLPGAGITPTQVVSYINGLSIDNLLAEVVPGETTNYQIVQLRTTQAGASKTIALESVDAVINGQLGGEFHDIDKHGLTQFDQSYMDIHTQNFPNPNDLDVDELVYDPDDIDVYIDIGTLTALSLDSAVERYGNGAIESPDDGDSDGLTPYIDIPLAATPTSNGATPTAVYDLNSTEDQCTVQGGATGDVPPAPVITADGTLVLSVDGSQPQEVELTSGMDLTAVAAEINKYFPNVATVAGGGGDELHLTSQLKGSESTIYIYPAPSSTAQTLTDLALTTVTGYKFGTWFPVLPNDEFYVAGTLVGVVTKVFPTGGADTRIRLDREIPESTYPVGGGTLYNFHFVSKNLTGRLPNILNTEPTPELYIDADGDVHIKHNIVRDNVGVPMFPGVAPVYIGYKALRVDVSADAEEPRLIEITSDDDITAQLGEIRTDNPLAFAVWLCRNYGSPDNVVYALGIGETSDDLPDGTLDAYTNAFELLENWDIYTIVTLTQSEAVHELGKAHVVTMSNPDNKSERIYFGTLERPTRAPDTVAISGTEGVTTGVADELNGNKPGLTQALQDIGVDPTNLDPTGTDPEDVYLDIEQDDNHYRVQSITGQVITVVDGTGQSWNTDGFYDSGNLPTPLINESWSLKARGAELVLTNGSPDKQAIARAISDTCYGFGSKRVFMGYPGNATIPDTGGLEQLLSSYYIASIHAGQIAAQVPQQPFSYMRVPAVTQVRGSTDYFSRDQLNVIAGGGCWIWFQETPSSGVQVRHQLSTDVSTVINRELSITKAIDYAAKFVRQNLRPMVGRFNITEETLEMCGTIMDGCCSYLTEDLKVFNNCTYTGFQIVDVDELEVIMEIELKYPLNKITVRIRV
jgi:hypothetical protein